MPTLESATIPFMNLTDTRTVYGSNTPIQHYTLAYSANQNINDECCKFHALLVKLGTVPVSLQQRYGKDPLATYSNPQVHPAEYIQKADVANLREAMEGAVEALLFNQETGAEEMEESWRYDSHERQMMAGAGITVVPEPIHSPAPPPHCRYESHVQT